ncbi:MAG: hypothetical protein WCT04_23150 [Planctomycetota bacterium]
MAIKKQATTKRKPAADARVAKPSFGSTFNLHGYDVGMSTLTRKLSARDLKSLTGTHGVAQPTGVPEISVLLVDDANDYEKGGKWHTPELLLGEGFALNYQTNTILYPRHAPRSMDMKNLGAQNPFVRTVIFCVGLLAEVNGLESVAQAGSNFQAPLYLHASSVLTPKGALVFCGECTFGKTTISTKLLKDFPLLEDDQVTILIASKSSKKAAAPRVVSFGDARKKGATLPAKTPPLAGIFWLKKDPENALEKMEQAEAAALMLNPMVNWKTGGAIKHRLQLFKALFDAVPCKRLAFKKESAPLVEFLKSEGYI